VQNFDHSHWIAMSPLTLLGTNVPAVMLLMTAINYSYLNFFYSMQMCFVILCLTKV